MIFVSCSGLGKLGVPQSERQLSQTRGRVRVVIKLEEKKGIVVKVEEVCGWSYSLDLISLDNSPLTFMEDPSSRRCRGLPSNEEVRRTTKVIVNI